MGRDGRGSRPACARVGEAAAEVLYGHRPYVTSAPSTRNLLHSHLPRKLALTLLADLGVSSLPGTS